MPTERNDLTKRLLHGCVLESVRAELHNRRKGHAVRLEIESSGLERRGPGLRAAFELEPSQVFRTDGPVNLSRLMNLYSEVKRPELKFDAFTAKEHKIDSTSGDMF